MRFESAVESYKLPDMVVKHRTTATFSVNRSLVDKQNIFSNRNRCKWKNESISPITITKQNLRIKAQKMIKMIYKCLFDCCLLCEIHMPNHICVYTFEKFYKNNDFNVQGLIVPKGIIDSKSLRTF